MSPDVCFERCPLGGNILEFGTVGEGPPVLFIHGAHIADSFAPLLVQPALREHYRLVLYHRRGFAGSDHPRGVVNVEEHVADARALLHHLGIRRAHVVGHSYGGVIGLQLAMDAPEIVVSLVLIEPALRGLLRGGAEAFNEALAPMQELHRIGRSRDAVEHHLLGIAGPHYRELLEAGAPGGLDQAAIDAETFFLSDFPGLLAWHPQPGRVQAIKAPVLYLIGGASGPTYHESCQLVREWLPQTDEVLVPGALHFLHFEQPDMVATAMQDFFESEV